MSWGYNPYDLVSIFTFLHHVIKLGYEERSILWIYIYKCKDEINFFPIIQIYEKLIEMANMYQNLRTIIMIENTSGICRGSYWAKSRHEIRIIVVLYSKYTISIISLCSWSRFSIGWPCVLYPLQSPCQYMYGVCFCHSEDVF